MSLSIASNIALSGTWATTIWFDRALSNAEIARHYQRLANRSFGSPRYDGWAASPAGGLAAVPSAG